MSQRSDFVVVICHGSFHTPAPYVPLMEALQARGIAAYCPQLPTSDLARLNVGDVNNPDFNRELPAGGYPQGEEAAETVLAVLKPLVEAGKGPPRRPLKHGLLTLVDEERYLFNCLDVADAKKWAATLTASPDLTTKLKNDAYAALPCGYLVLDQDRMIPRELQEHMIRLQASKTGDFTVYHCPADHSPQLSWIQGVVDTAVDFVGKIKTGQIQK
ncbi:d3b01ae1-476a-4b86-990e-452dbd42bc30 [Thermothielavioides terrestris]|uniref:D3b01ae1-476a-4b86-990e-452dbd42bc30 n=1 Tax=Thermothielavioides terrestris TaxID=2587410 RepID=A0A3S4BF50_9PEZI|nr:d3b01ae1-476a-4b86-990e-452dbd42bc30 [Thermothielavioides terrestris]